MPADPFSALLSTSKPGVFVDAISGRSTGRGPHDLGEEGFVMPAKPRTWSARPKLLPAMSLVVASLVVAVLALA